jgi:glycosyltransferase involved in cell wall biosynthesis
LAIVVNQPLAELVSVIVLARNSERTIGEAIASLLCQTHHHLEILVIDGGSIDSTLERVNAFKDPRIRIIAQQESGLGNARNLGIHEARGEFIAYLDADDVAVPHRIEAQLEFLLRCPEHAVVGSWLKLIDSQGAELGVRRYVQYDHEIRASMASFNALPNPGVMFQKNLITAAGLYSEALPEDYDLWLRLLDFRTNCGKAHNLPEVLTHYRVHLGGSKARTAKLQLLWSLQLRYKYWRQGSLRVSMTDLARNLAQVVLLVLPASWMLSLFLWSVKRGQV